MGSDIDGACGQLRKRYMEKQKVRSDMRVYSATDVGQKRKMNQDYVFVSETPVGNSRICSLLPMEWAVIMREITLPLMPFRLW